MSVIARSAALLLASTILAAPAAAQLASVPPMPRSRVVDVNNVDLVTGTYISPAAELSIGTDQSGIVYSQKLANGQWWISNFHIALETTATTATVTIGTEAKKFNGSGSTYTSSDADGSTLTFNSGTQNYSYTSRDGTLITIPNGSRRASSIKYPNGALFTLYYDQDSVTGPPAATFYRLRSIGTSNGHQVRLTYLLSSMSNNANNYRAWAAPSSVKIVSNAVEACQPSAASCDFTGTWPELLFSGALSRVVTGPSGSVSYVSAQYSPGYYRVTAVKRASSSTDNTTISYDANNRVSQVTTDGRTWTYSYSLAAPLITTTITNPDNSQRVVVSNVDLGVPLSVQVAPGRTTSYTYDGNGRLTRITQPEGNYTESTYDGRGNATQSKLVSKTPGTPADIVTSATYPATCTNALTCNKPTSTTDARGNVTDYTYDSAHGGVLTLTRPAPTTGAVRPQTRFGYTSLQAYFKNAAGSIVASGVPTWQLTSASECQTLASCAGGADEVKTTISYGPQVAGTANQLYPVSISKGSGNGSLTATASYDYNSMGDLISVDGPLAGTADKTRFYYDDSRNAWGTIGPDPDGTGPLLNRAQRTTFAADMAIKVEYGTTAGQGAFAWDGFNPLQEVETHYDVSGRKVRDVLTSGGATYALTQYSYDAKGRLGCTAQRMNPAAYGSLPASACTPGPPAPTGPDRIAKAVYNSADEVTQVQTAVGTADLANERTLTYTNNGQLQTLKDAENNLTTYEYDGHDRLAKTRFPLPTKGANASSTTDYEELGYDPASNVTSRRLRDGASVTFAYDALNRLTVRGANSEPTRSYAYDNLGRMTAANVFGLDHTFTYDALSRNLTEAGPRGTAASQWDLAGRRTRLTYPGTGLYLTYDYLVTGETAAIRENGAASGVGVLATFAYDDLGRRTSLTRGNGTVTSYAFDPVSRLASLSQNLAGTGNDLTIGSIAYNPASQIISQNRSNDAYAWTGHGSGSTDYAADGLNRLCAIGSSTCSGGAATSHDARGNLTHDPTTGKTYTYYPSTNQLWTVSSPWASFGYDALGRLAVIDTSADVKFAYDGLDAIAEYDGAGALQRRFVHGPGIDEPLVQYEGTGTTGRRFLHADERGSIVAISDSSGAMLTINRYDEYGKPAATNSGRFQYTGQMWLPEAGLYHYKARAYAPHLGRFLQTDPIGYGAGINLYAYVDNDPINKLDPFGLTDIYSCSDGREYDNGAACGPGSPETLEYLAWLAEIADTIVVTAHKQGGIDEFEFRYNRREEFLIYVYRDGGVVDAQPQEQKDQCSGGTVFRPAVSVDPARSLWFIIHGHQDLASGEFRMYSYPSAGDGITPTLRQITNYQLASGDVFAIRPHPSMGVGPIDHLVGGTNLPSSVESALRSNAQSAMNARSSNTKVVCKK